MAPGLFYPETMQHAPIFIIGTERSGTNLLRLILNCHASIAVPHPPHIMKLFTPLVPLYGNLAIDSNFRRLINDVCRMVELHTYPWELKPDRERIFAEADARELICIYLAVHDQYLQFIGKNRWCCKSTFMIDHVADIIRFRPDARFIFMVRDGRDVAVSAKRSIFNHYHVYYTAKRWQREQALGLQWLAKLPANQIMLLKYEELLSSPADTVRKLCDFLQEPYSDTMLEYHRHSEARKSGSLSLSWQNTAKPLLTNNQGKFHNALKSEEIYLFETIAANELTALGYALVTPEEQLLQADSRGVAEKLSYGLAELGQKIRTEMTHLLKDRNSVLRIRKNLYMTGIKILRKLTRADV